MGTVVVSLALAAIVCAIVIKLIKDKKRGRTSCGCGCEDCAVSGACHKNK